MIERLSPSQRNEAVELLCAAFRDYPVMRFVLGDAGDDHEARLRELIGFFCDKRLTRGWPVLALREEGRCAGVALVSEPEPVPAPPALLAAHFRLRNRLGDDAMDRLAAFEEATDRFEPAEPHHLLGVLGVHPDFQRRGFARRLLDEVASLARRHPTSAGVWLTTEDPGNVPFYLGQGFRNVGEVDVGRLHSWAFVRSC